ncbi:hypothetical protein LLG90_26675, partial [Aromatoleum toluclasticum]|uniref:hypothetical protein n=1 Tax=Aromatoleum toluclasticum TaxID=92003 RepID=UPI001D17FACD
GRKSTVFGAGRQDEAFHDAMWSALAMCGEWEGEVWNLVPLLPTTSKCPSPSSAKLPSDIGFE